MVRPTSRAGPNFDRTASRPSTETSVVQGGDPSAPLARADAWIDPPSSPSANGPVQTSAGVVIAHAPLPPALPAALEPFRELLPAIGHLFDPKRRQTQGPDFPMGTAFHVGEGIVLTAGHTIADDAGPLTITWGEVPGAKDPLVSQVTEIIGKVLEFNTVDFTILRVSPAPDAQLEMDVSGKVLGRKVTVLGHPKDRPLQAQPPGAVTQVFSAQTFRHDVPVVGGNSGGPVLDLKTRKVVGIVMGGAGFSTSLSEPRLHEALQQLGVVRTSLMKRILEKLGIDLAR